MSNLVAYDSSDEEDVLNIMNEQSQGHPPSEAPDTAENPEPATQTLHNGTAHGSLRPSGPSNEPDLSSLCANGAMLGPAGPPSPTSQNSNTISSPSSPYTSQRATIRSLTLPADPNLDIPPSPPGSPTPGADQKFVHFLKLKKQGVHFNAKLASSSALKNPSLLPKLMNFAGVEEQKQYATTLPMPLWDPAGFSNWAYKEELAKDQQMVAKRKEEERSRGSREIDFVSATNSVHSSRAGTPGLANGLRGAKGSAAERIMADLDRRGGRPDTARSRGSSRSPKRRKRSRSR